MKKNEQSCETCEKYNRITELLKGYNPQTAGIDKNSKLLKEIYEICKENIQDS